jgi:CheY-like chemotaxis protein
LKLPLAAKVKEYVQRVYAAGTGLLGIINDILDSTKIEFGKLRIEQIPFDLHATAKDALDAVITRADEKGLRCMLKVAPSVPRVVIGDPLRVRQVLINILGNAVKFTERGSVTLEVSSEVSEHAGTIEFKVSDTGIGIADDQIQRLFEPFSQADDSTTRRFGGTGLGLSISRRLIDLMDGRLGVTSVLGQGSQFVIALPLHEADVDASVDFAATQSSVDDRYDGICILCVDDNAENRNLAVELLQTVGAQVVVAADGQEGIDQLFAHPSRFDLVLMDIHMPNLDGYEATQRIRAREEFCELPIVAATASASPEEWAKCLAVGMNDYLVKPISPNLLFAKLRQWIRHRGSSASASANSVAIAGKTPASVDAADVPRSRDALIDYLEACDSMARDFFDEHEATVVYGLPVDTAARLANFVRTYRYEHALDELRRIGATVGETEQPHT